MGFTSDELLTTLRSQNVLEAGSEIVLSKGSSIIEVSGMFENEKDLGLFSIPTKDRVGSVQLNDIANIRRSIPEPATQRAFFNGEPAVILAVAMQNDFSVLDYAPKVKAMLGDLQIALPVGLKLDIVTYQAEQVEKAIFGVSSNVLQTLLIVLAVVIMFLGVKTGTIVGFIVPSVMLATLALMGVFGISLERMSLATMVISLGLLVDNGIVMAEDFKRRLEDGLSRDEALAVCGKELAMPLLSSTLTTIFFFLPLMLAAHDAGEYTRSISLVILLSLTTSWLLAMTVTPILCFHFMKLPKKNSNVKVSFFSQFEHIYGKMLAQILRQRTLFMVLIILSFGLSVFGMSNVSKKMFPDSDRPQVLIQIEAPSGTTISQVSDDLQQMFPLLSDKKNYPYIRSYAAYSGYGGPRFVLSLAPLDSASNVAFLVINIDSTNSMTQALTELRQMYREHFPGLNARVSGMFFGPSDPNVLQVQVKGPDENVVYEYGQLLASRLKNIPSMIDVWQNWETPIAKIYVNIDQNKARRASISTQQVADALSTYYSGQTISMLYQGSKTLPIVVRGQKEQREALANLYGLNINLNDLQAIPLMQVADITLQPTQSAIHRQNLVRSVTVEGRPLSDTPEDLIPVVDVIIKELNDALPVGHWIEYDGIITHSTEGVAALSANFPLALGAVLLLLIIQFNGFERPVIIIATIPLMIVGSAIGLHLFNGNFGFMVILGLMALAGIIINNALVLIDRIDIELQTNTDFTKAIIKASMRRLRPIIMTTVTTVLGLLPLIVTNDPLFKDMSVVIAMGLVIGTIMTLGVTPVLYSLLIKKKVLYKQPSNQELVID